MPDLCATLAPSDWIAIVAIVAGTGGTLGGVALGAWIEKRRSDRETVRGREEEAAEVLDLAAVEALAVLPVGVMSRHEAAPGLESGQQMLLSAWSRTTVLADPGIDRRFHALRMALHIAIQDCQMPPSMLANEAGEVADMNFYPLSVAVRDLRMALAAFRRREPLPDPEFPSARECIKLAHPDGRNVGLEGIGADLIEREVL